MPVGPLGRSVVTGPEAQSSDGCAVISLFALSRRDARGYGVRPSRTYSLGDQLGLFLGTKSKIADRSGMETLGGHVTTVADFQP